MSASAVTSRGALDRFTLMRSPRENEAERRARFERLYDAHYAAVLAYALRRTGHTIAHDVAAETFLVAWRRFEFVPVDAAPWLYGVARRVLANERRAEHRRAALAERMRAMGCAPTAMRVRLHRARRRLSRALEDPACSGAPSPPITDPVTEVVT